MSRILLVDDSPHAQRMGERILSEEGYEVVTVSNTDSALIRLDDVDPDVVVADTVMPGRTGFEICQYLKMSPRHGHVRVILTAGVLETMDEAQVKRVEADGTLRKPFEATALLSAVKPLADAAAAARAEAARPEPKGAPKVAPTAVPFVAVIDAEQVRAAVTVALDASMGTIVDEITARVLAALNTRKSDATPEIAPARPQPPVPAAPPPPPLASPHTEPVRRVNPLKIRTSSILGLELDSATDAPPPEPRPIRARALQFPALGREARPSMPSLPQLPSGLRGDGPESQGPASDSQVPSPNPQPPSSSD